MNKLYTVVAKHTYLIDDWALPWAWGNGPTQHVLTYALELSAFGAGDVGWCRAFLARVRPWAQSLVLGWQGEEGKQEFLVFS